MKAPDKEYALRVQIADLRLVRDAAEKREKTLTEKIERQRRSLEVYQGNLKTVGHDLDRALAALRAIGRARKACSRIVRVMTENGPRMLVDALTLAVDTLADIDPGTTNWYQS